MYDFIAKNPKQLDICLRMLYAEHCEFTLTVRETVPSGKIVYAVTALTGEVKKAQLREKYRIMTS